MCYEKYPVIAVNASPPDLFAQTGKEKDFRQLLLEF